jgi:hypothetical protein
MANEIKKDENKLIDIYQSDIDVEFNIMQNLVFQKCGGLEIDGEMGIVEKQKLSMSINLDLKNGENDSKK